MPAMAPETLTRHGKRQPFWKRCQRPRVGLETMSATARYLCSFATNSRSSTFGQDPVPDRGAGQGGLPVHIRMTRIEGVKPEDQRLDVTDHVLNVVFHESQQPQAAGRDRLPLARQARDP